MTARERLMASWEQLMASAEHMKWLQLTNQYYRRMLVIVLVEGSAVKLASE